MSTSGYYSHTGTGNSPEVVKAGDVLVDVLSSGTISGTVIIEEWVPGYNAWVPRATYTALQQNQTIKGTTDPDNRRRYRSRCSAFVTGPIQVVMR